MTNAITPEMIQQIIKNQEIVERLMERIKFELQIPEKRWGHKGVINMLQSILGENK